jgi:transcriptional regulator with XRE-family HTH domain
MKRKGLPEEAIGVSIRRERERLGLSQEQLAFECGLHRTYVGSVERGERNVALRNIIAIAAALGLTGSGLMAAAEL